MKMTDVNDIKMSGVKVDLEALVKSLERDIDKATSISNGESIRITKILTHTYYWSSYRTYQTSDITTSEEYKYKIDDDDKLLCFTTVIRTLLKKYPDTFYVKKPTDYFSCDDDDF
tara:strand:- start:265 stop:609 length:345 start_codon:yes stop_codon:yes gene_type:complete